MADSDIVIWFAEHHCFGDLLVARRLVARWTVSEAHRWLRVAFGDEAKDCGHDEAAPPELGATQAGRRFVTGSAAVRGGRRW